MAYTFSIRRMTFEIPTLVECSDTYTNVRDGLGLGASGLPPTALYRDGKQVGHISYNGRIWAGSAAEWTSKTPLLYDNRGVGERRVTCAICGMAVRASETCGVCERNLKPMEKQL